MKPRYRVRLMCYDGRNWWVVCHPVDRPNERWTGYGSTQREAWRYLFRTGTVNWRSIPKIPALVTN